MRHFITFAVTRPKSVIVLIILITAFFMSGIRHLKMDPSTEALMPKHVAEYRYNTRMKKIFGDSKLYLAALVEPESANIFSIDGFKLMDKVVTEIEEFKDFDYTAENHRLETVINLGNVQYIGGEDIERKQENTLISDEEIDNLLSGEGELEGREYFDVFAINEPLPDDIYKEPIRNRRSYDYISYAPVSLKKLNEVLDQSGKAQLQTVLFRTGLYDKEETYIFSQKEYAQIIEEFETAYLFKSMEAVKSFMNPISGEDIVGTEDSLIPVDLVEADDTGVRELPISAEDFDAYKAKLRANPVFENTLYSLDRKNKISALAMSIQLANMENIPIINHYLQDIFAKYNMSGMLNFTPLGSLVYERYIQDYMKSDMRKFMPVVLLVVILTFLFNFKMVRGVVLPTIAIVLSIIWTMGLMGYLGIPVTMVVNVLPTILVAVGSSYSIHIFNQYLHDRKDIKKDNKKAGLIGSMSRIAFTVFLAAFTTFIGFSTLGFNQVVSLKHFGTFAAIGTIFAMLIASLLIPAVLSMTALPKKVKNEKNNKPDLLTGLLEKTGSLTVKHSGVIIVLSSVMIAIALAGLTKLTIEASPLDSFKDNSYVVQADKKVSQALRGATAFNLLIDTGKDGGAKDPKFLKKIDELGQWISSTENQQKYQFLVAYTFSDTIKRMNKAMHGGDNNCYTIPDDLITVEDYLMLYSGEDKDSDGRVDTMERFVDSHYRVANIFIKTGTYDGREYTSSKLLAGMDAVKEHLACDSYFSKYNYTFAGQNINYSVLTRLIAHGQILTILLTLLLIGIVIYILFKDIKCAIISLIPISCSMLVVFGTMGYFNIPLDLVKSIISAVTIGIGIDDTIHMLKTIRSKAIEGASLKEAILHAYREAGVAIIYTSIALIFGFGVLMLSEFKVLFFLGWLVAFNMVVTTIAALVVLPAAMLVLQVEFKPQAEKEHAERIGRTEISYEGE